jgi:hypothetical protein
MVIYYHVGIQTMRYSLSDATAAPPKHLTKPTDQILLSIFTKVIAGI